MTPGAPGAGGERVRLGIVVLNWNGYELTRRCLDSLAPSLTDGMTVYLVDNGSSDGSGERLAAERAGPAFVHLANGGNLGFAAGNNPGIQRALADGCDHVLLLNNDTVCIQPGFLSRGLAVLASDRGVGIVGGKLVLWPDTQRLWSVGGEIRWWNERFIGLGELDRGQYDAPADRTFVSGALMLVRREVFERIGLLPEVYFFGSEDREFSVLARRAGFRLRYEPGFRVAHEAGGSHAAVNPEWIHLDAVSRQLFRRRTQGHVSHALWRALYACHLALTFPLLAALRPGRLLAGLRPPELRRILWDAWRDAPRVDRTTLAMLEGYRMRRRG